RSCDPRRLADRGRAPGGDDAACVPAPGGRGAGGDGPGVSCRGNRASCRAPAVGAPARPLDSASRPARRGAPAPAPPRARAPAARGGGAGPRFFEADALLRDAVRAADGVGYAVLPSELEANAASAAYASRTLGPVELEALRGLDELRPLLDSGNPPADVVDTT